MNPERTNISRCEKGMMILLGAVFLLPLILTGLVKCFPEQAGGFLHPWVQNKSLNGTQLAEKSVGFSWSALAEAKYQDSLAKQFDKGFAGREALIRWTNEAYLQWFNEPSSKSSTLAVGKNRWLFEKVYLEEYFLDRIDKSVLVPFANDLAELQKKYRAKGKGFVLLLSPSKAAAYPEEAPSGWQARYNPKPRAITHMMELCKERGIAFVNGPEIARLEGVKKAKRPSFPVGGIHWMDHCSMAATNKLLETLQTQGVKVQQIPNEIRKKNDIYRGGLRDRDLVELLNIAIPWNYPTNRAVITELPNPAIPRPRGCVVGGSFTFPVLEQLRHSHQLEELYFYYYYTTQLMRYTDESYKTVAQPVPPVKFETDVFGADFIILEINEEVLVKPVNHLRAFVADMVNSLNAHGL